MNLLNFMPVYLNKTKENTSLFFSMGIFSQYTYSKFWIYSELKATNPVTAETHISFIGKSKHFIQTKHFLSENIYSTVIKLFHESALVVRNI